MSKHCIRCRQPMQVETLPATKGEASHIAVTLPDFPALVCPNGHKRFLDAEFPARLLDAVLSLEQEVVPHGAEQGFILKRYLCGKCGEPLSAKKDHRHNFALSIELPELRPIRVEINAPVYRCPACGIEQIHSEKELRRETPAALMHAFEAAGIQPD